MVEMVPDSMGYDRAIVVFSPDGRLFQVEYAREAVKKGATAVGITYKDGVVFAVKKRESKLVKPGEKIFKLDDHVAAASSGLVADARIIVDSARVKAQQNRLVYDEPVSITAMSKFIADKQQVYTQYAGVRPYGVSFLIGGVNPEPTLYETDPSGIMLDCKARTIGRMADKINEFLEESFKSNMSAKDAIQLAADALKKESKMKLEEFVVMQVQKDGCRELSSDDLKQMGVKV